MRREVLLVLLLAVLLVVLCGCLGGREGEVPHEVFVEGETGGGTGDTQWMGVERYAYTFLNEEEQKVYRDLVEAIGSFVPTLEHLTLGEEAFFKVIKFVRLDYPEFFWLANEGTLHTVTDSSGKQEISYEIEYTMSKKKAKQAQAEIASAQEECFAQIRDGMSDYEKIKAVYEYIILNTDYKSDLQGGETIYDVLAGRLGICAGYTRSMQYLLNQMGLFCAYISGEVYDRGPHAWNLVRLDGEYYYVDATWGDPISIGGIQEDVDSISYNYLCITTEELKRSRGIDSIVPVPDCTATKYDYYALNQRLFSQYIYDDMVNAALRVVGEGDKTLTVKFTNAEALVYAEYDLIEQKRIFDLLNAVNTAGGPQIADNACSHSKNEEMRTLTFYFEEPE